MRCRLWGVAMAFGLAGCTVVQPTLPSGSFTPSATVGTRPTLTATLEPPALPSPSATPQPSPAPTLPLPRRSATFTLTVLYDNIPYDTNVQTDWGFACLAQGPERTVLFDTGGNGATLLRNIRTLGLDPQAVDVVVLSHAHGDHTGGLATFLAENPRVTVYVLATFPTAIKETVQRAGATLVEVDGPMAIGTWAYSTGALGTAIPEQALVLTTPRGLVVITGCAHPGIETLAQQAQVVADGELYLVLGGFHLGNATARQIADTITALQGLGVQRVAPSHCTGDAARRALAETFGPAYVESGAGQVFVIALEGQK